MPSRIVLIVEDDASVIASYAMLLREVSESIIPLAAPTGEKARTILAGERPDLIILDLFLPDALGTDVMRAAREAHPGVPVILITAYPDLVREAGVDALPGTRLFSKPLNTEALLAALQESLRKEVC